VRLLLDTHVLLWWLADDARLTAAHRGAVSHPANTILYSAVTVAEVALKASVGKLEAPTGLGEHLISEGFEELPLRAAHAERLRDLPWLHRDPFDRMLIAQAQEEDLTFVTVDRRCRDYDVRVL